MEVLCVCPHPFSCSVPQTQIWCGARLCKAPALHLTSLAIPMHQGASHPTGFSMCFCSQSYWPHLGNFQVSKPIMRSREMQYSELCSDPWSVVLMSVLHKLHGVKVGSCRSQKEIKVCVIPKDRGMDDDQVKQQWHCSLMSLTPKSYLSFKSQLGYYFHREVFLSSPWHPF